MLVSLSRQFRVQHLHVATGTSATSTLSRSDNDFATHLFRRSALKVPTCHLNAAESCLSVPLSRAVLPLYLSIINPNDQQLGTLPRQHGLLRQRQVQRFTGHRMPQTQLHRPQRQPLAPRRALLQGLRGD